jgi:GWxTD domain-containing protein
MGRRPAAWALLPALVALVLGVLTAAGCGPAPSVLDDPRRNRLPLDAWVSVTQDTTGQVRPVVSVSAPHRSLIFEARGDALVSRLQVEVVAVRGERQAGGGVQTAAARVGSFAATRSDESLELTVPLRVRGDDPVQLQVRAQVVGTSRVWLRDLRWDPGSLAVMPAWISAVRTGLVAEPGVGRVLPPEARELELNIVVQRRRDGPPWPADGLELVSEVSAVSQDATAAHRQSVPALAAGDTVHLREIWPAARLPFGRCRVAVAIESQQGGKVVRLPREPALELVNLAVPLADDRAWRRHLQWLDGWLDADRRDSLATLAEADRPRAWSHIFSAVGSAIGEDATTAEREHLLRIVEADDRFGSFGRGALSDRGRVFIRWGEPARIETFADAHTPGAVWEVWVYPRQGVRLLFHDLHGFGDFRLRREEPLTS